MIWNENQIDEQFYPGPDSESSFGGIAFSFRQTHKAVSAMGASMHGLMTPLKQLNHLHIDLNQGTYTVLGGWKDESTQSDHQTITPKYRENPPHPMAPPPDALVYDRRGRKRY